MKELVNDLRPEHDLSKPLKTGVRMKYAEGFRAGTNLVLLEANIPKNFFKRPGI
ncbi:MAG TPA: hypothetical protein VGD14_16495 [bacterium]